jgi:hypothetical protein
LVVVVRRYAEPVEVTSVPVGVGEAAPDSPAALDDPLGELDAQPDGGPGRGGRAAHAVRPGQPQAFVWRGRRYLVREVLGQWRERRAWWREALDLPPGVPHGIAAAARERHVWRVEAGLPRSDRSGVFDLAHDEGEPPDEPSSRGWELVRVAD